MSHQHYQQSGGGTPGCSKSPSHIEPNSRHEIEHAVSELFDHLNVTEGKHFSRHSVAERMERSTRRQSSKPFELFYNKASDNNPLFVEKYQAIKCQNINEVDPFVRFLVRVRDDPTLCKTLKQTGSDPINSVQTQMSQTSTSKVPLRNGSSSGYKTPRPKSSGYLINTMPYLANGAIGSITPNQSIYSNNTPVRGYNTLTTPITSKKVMNLVSPEMASYGDRRSEEFELGPSSVSSTSKSKPKVQHQSKQSSSSDQQHRSKRAPNYMSRDFQPCDWPKEKDCFGRLGEMSVVEQEQTLLRDLLFVLIGIDSRHIRLVRSDESSRYKLQLDPTADQFLAATTNRIMKIAYSYSSIVTFLESRCYGMVNQALVAAMREHMHEYDVSVAKMEDMLFRRDLFLQKMFFILLPYFSTFSLLRDLSTRLYKNKCVGGAVLTILHEKTKSIQGMDNNALELCLGLTRKACAPYFGILSTWIYYGEVDDPRREFFIEDVIQQQNESDEDNIDGLRKGFAGQSSGLGWDSDEEIDEDFAKLNDNYWDTRYRINPSKLPIFLKRHEPIIYKTGKYVSIINKVRQLYSRTSGVNHGNPLKLAGSSLAASDMSVSTSSSSTNSLVATTRTPRPQSLEYSFDECSYLAPIESAYEEASGQLLEILMHQSQLVETLSAVRHYLLQSQGDFLVHFISFASKDLCRRTDSVVQHRLDSMMGMAMGISVNSGDRVYLKDDPHIEFVGKSFLKQISQLMRAGNTLKDVDLGPSPTSSVLWKCEVDDDEEGEEVVSLNRSIVGNVISEGTKISRDIVDSLDEVKQRRLYANSGTHLTNPRTPSSMTQSAGPALAASSSPSVANSARLFCYESLGLKFDVPFPLSLIFSQKSIICYELLFRYIFLCRYAAMELEETWKDNLLNTQLNDPQTWTEEGPSTVSFKAVHRRAFALRYKMIAFVRNFHYFYAFEVIDPSFGSFIENIQRKGTSLDSVIECHEKFLENCFASCFLTNLPITTIIIKVFTLCIELSHALKESIEPEHQTCIMQASCFFSADNPNGGTPNQNARNLTQVAQIVKKAEVSFETLITQLLSKIYTENASELHMMFPFVARLDYNHFYWNKINEAKSK